MKNTNLFLIWVLLLTLLLTSCGSGQTPELPQGVGPSISVEITKGSCPSIEATSEMQIIWTNNDDQDHTLLIERKDEQGVVMEAGGTDVVQPGDIFTITSLAPGEYTYYCSKDRTVFGSISITP